MQRLDPDDTRRPNVQIAGSLRAAILTDEFRPGERLPSGKELAAFFGVSVMTVQNAIHTLRDEGFVDTRTGSGVYVRAQANLPVEEGTSHPLEGLASFLFEVGHLKNLKRAGWVMLGVPQPESVADHTFRVGIIGISLAQMAGADVGRVAALCLMHDVPETRVGDVEAVGRAYVTTAKPEAITAHQTAGMPVETGTVFQDLVAEYEAQDTVEARIARDADKIDVLLQAIEYGKQGFATDEWRENAINALRTESGKQLAQAVSLTDPTWWTMFGASYAELRSSTRAAQTRKA
ncbi:HD domain-containing protein [Microlunatus speluncae]|uniref:HD domain-containing protein n=1 Tax=Microlunatus speluncae TaxID=2594267 RepID=UPI001266854E|nr:HD domain-containing protein [Microlunatus speluncae]